MNKKIGAILVNIGAIKKENEEIFSTKTRDNKNLTVYRDRISKVIYIDDFYIGEKVYENGQYRSDLNPLLIRDFEDVTDSERRFNSYKQFLVAKSIVDFGCGAGSFLEKSKSLAKSVTGIELQQNYIDNLNKKSIKCFKDIREIENEQDSIFLFHCLEHLQNPVDLLMEIHKKLKINKQGKIIIEVPHAKDFLIDTLRVQPFIDFTLWSQHLVLHTRESLRLLLVYCGFKNIIIEGIQRYSISNHLSWLNYKKPGGHKESLSIFETQELINAYASALSKIDANDTLVAIADS
jgi:2-polyprenyl-3-methyl-5-hydroxy-6-metoxy-1,4-benzoquinol methylase